MPAAQPASVATRPVDAWTAEQWSQLPAEAGQLPHVDGPLTDAMRQRLATLIEAGPLSAQKAAADWLDKRLAAGFAEAADYEQLGLLLAATKDHERRESALWNGLNRFHGCHGLYAQLLDLYDPPGNESSPIRRASTQHQRVVMKLMRDAPDSAMARLVRGSYSLAFGHLDVAEQLFVSVLGEQPDDLDALEGLARVRHRQNDAKAFEQLVGQMVHLAPNTTHVLVTAEELYHLANMDALADQVGERWRKLEPNPVARAQSLATFYYERGRFSDAAAAYEAVFVELGPATPEDFVGTWVALCAAAGEAEQALQRFDGHAKTMKWSPETVVLSKAGLLDAAGRWDEAQTMLTSWLEGHPADAAVCNFLAYQWVIRHERLDEALGLVQKALAQAPMDPNYLDTRGWALYKLGRFQEAVDVLETADSMGNDPLVMMHLGDAQYRMGNPDNARRQWARARHFLLTQRFGQDAEMQAMAEGVMPRIQAVSRNEPAAVAPTADEPLPAWVGGME